MTPQQVFNILANKYESGKWVFSSNDESGMDNFKSVPAGMFEIIKHHLPDNVIAQVDLLNDCRGLMRKHLGLDGLKEIYQWNDEDDRSQENVIEDLIKLSRVK